MQFFSLSFLQIGNVFREVIDLSEAAQQERGRSGFRLWLPDSVDTEDEAWSRMPFVTNFLQLTPSGPALSQSRNPMLPETHRTCFNHHHPNMISNSLSNHPYKSASDGSNLSSLAYELGSQIVCCSLKWLKNSVKLGMQPWSLDNIYTPLCCFKPLTWNH